MVAERSSGSMDPVDPDALERAEIPTVFRGADTSVVRRLLALAAHEIRRLRDELDAAPAPTPVETADPLPLDEAELTERLGEEAVLVLTSARDAAAQVRARAEEKVARLVREAQHEANEIRSAADRERAFLLQEARDEAASLRESASRLHDEAAAQVEAELTAAQDRARELAANAQHDHERLLAELTEHRDGLADEIAELDRMRTDAAALLARISAGLARHAERLEPAPYSGGSPSEEPAIVDAELVDEPAPVDDPSPLDDGPVVDAEVVDGVELDDADVDAAEAVVDEPEPDPAPAEADADAQDEFDEVPVAAAEFGSGPVAGAEFDEVPVAEAELDDGPVDDGLPRGDVSQFRVEPTDEIEIVRIVGADDKPSESPAASVSNGFDAPSGDLVGVDDGVVEVEESPEPPLDESVAPGPVDFVGVDAGVVEAEASPEPPLDESVAPGPVAGDPPDRVMRVTEPLLAHDDLPVRLSAGGPLDPQPGEYVVDATPPNGALDRQAAETLVAAVAADGALGAEEAAAIDGSDTAGIIDDGATNGTVVDLTDPAIADGPQDGLDLTDPVIADGPQDGLDLTDRVIADGPQDGLDLTDRVIADGPQGGLDLTDPAIDGPQGGLDLTDPAIDGPQGGLDLTDPAIADAQVIAEEATPVEPTFLDGVFARLRAERDARTEQARSVLTATATLPVTDLTETEPAESAAPAAEPAPAAVTVETEPVLVEDTAPEPSPSTEGDASTASVFAGRDQLLDRHTGALASQLKRVLADRQNAVLDGLNRNVALEELAAETAMAYRRAATDELAEAATAASSLTGEPFVVDAGDLGEALGAEVTQPLFRRLQAAVDEGHDGLAGRVRAIHREWRSQHIATIAEGFVAAALARGLIAGVKPGTGVRWVCDPGHACPDGTDNELAGDVPFGEPFPTGHIAAPIHLGCRCLVLAV